MDQDAAEQPGGSSQSSATRIALAVEDIDRPVAEVQVDVEDKGFPDLSLVPEFFQGDGHVVEVAEAPRVVNEELEAKPSLRIEHLVEHLRTECLQAVDRA
jgi:hypothetical protein